MVCSSKDGEPAHLVAASLISSPVWDTSFHAVTPVTPATAVFSELSATVAAWITPANEDEPSTDYFAEGASSFLYIYRGYADRNNPHISSRFSVCTTTKVYACAKHSFPQRSYMFAHSAILMTVFYIAEIVYTYYYTLLCQMFLLWFISFHVS